MARSTFQKLKIIYIMDYLNKYSDEEHPVGISDIISELERRGIAAERKSIYDDLDCLREYGLDIVHTGSGRNSGYYVAQRLFELPELKLLVDSVQCSKFITHKKTVSLIKKIGSLASVHEHKQLDRQVYVNNRIKTMNESIYYNVDEIHRAIAENSRIRFRYFEYGVNKKKRFRHDGAWYELSPFSLGWDDENYYLVAYDSEAERIKHFRVDKMADITLTHTPRDGQELYKSLDMGVYSRKTFGMFTGEETRVQLRFENELVGAVIDRLGRDVMLIPDGDRHFTLSCDVVISPQFFAWIFGFEGRAKILSPTPVREAMAAQLRRVEESLE